MKKIQFFLIFNVLFASEFVKDSNSYHKAILIQRWWKNSLKLKQKLFYDLSDVRRKLLDHNGLASLGSSNIFTGCKQLPPVKLTIKSMREELKARNTQLKILISNVAKLEDN
jgi:hypothetical protein